MYSCIFAGQKFQKIYEQIQKELQNLYAYSLEPMVDELINR